MDDSRFVGIVEAWDAAGGAHGAVSEDVDYVRDKLAHLFSPDQENFARLRALCGNAPDAAVVDFYERLFRHCGGSLIDCRPYKRQFKQIVACVMRSGRTGSPSSGGEPSDEEILLQLVEQMQGDGVRRRGLDVYEPIVLGAVSMRAYRLKQSIRSYIYDNCSRLGTELLTVTVTKKSTIKHYIDRFEGMDAGDELLPRLETDRVLYSFRNGMVDFRNEEFELVAHDSMLVNPADLPAHRFLDMDFDNDTAIDLCTPGMDQILAAQGITPGPLYWTFMAFVFGRTLFEPTYDNWQKCVLIFGESGTGKSIIGNALTAIVGEENTALLPNNGEARWLAGQLLHKTLFVCTELGDGCKWPKQFFLNLVGDQKLNYELKYAQPGTMVNKAQGLLLSNTGVPWIDDRGEIKRRIMPFYFPNPVAAHDPHLQDRVMNELPQLMAKGVQAYHGLRHHMVFHDGSVESHLASILPAGTLEQAYDAMLRA